MIKYYLENNLMVASPSSHLDSLYADLQMHALNVSDGLAKVLTALGSGSLTTWMTRLSPILTPSLPSTSLPSLTLLARLASRWRVAWIRGRRHLLCTDPPSGD